MTSSANLRRAEELLREHAEGKAIVWHDGVVKVRTHQADGTQVERDLRSNSGKPVVMGETPTDVVAKAVLEEMGVQSRDFSAIKDSAHNLFDGLPADHGVLYLESGIPAVLDRLSVARQQDVGLSRSPSLN